VRENYWIVKGRGLVRKIICRRVICRCYDGKPFLSSVVPDLYVPDLSAERVSTEPLFCNTGIDFAGPLYVRGAGGT